MRRVNNKYVFPYALHSFLNKRTDNEWTQDLKINYVFLQMLNKQIGSMVCAFCNAKIDYGKSVCDACAKKFNIRTYDMSMDGCGCDG
jgi:hypothetical protein